jgi:hypothetical protein
VRNYNLSVKVTVSMYHALWQRSVDQHISVSDATRLALAQYLATPQPKKVESSTT